MAYLGPPPSQKLATPTSQYFSGNGSATAFTLNRPVNVAEDLNVFVNNVAQQPGSGKSYTATGTTLTFDAAPASGTNNVYVVYRGLAEPTTRLEHPSGQPLAATTGAFSGNVTIGGNLSVTGTGAGAAGITSASTSGTAINIDSSNRVTMPAKPAFNAYYSGDGSSYTVAGGGGVIVFNATRFNTGSHYDTSNGRFTAPVAGVYQFSFISFCYNSGQLGAAATATIYLRLNGSNHQNMSYVYNASTTSYSPGNGTTVLSLSASDYIEIHTNFGVYTDSSNSYLNFSGYLIS